MSVNFNDIGVTMNALRYRNADGNFDRPARIIETGFNGDNIVVAVSAGTYESIVVMTADGRLAPDEPVRLFLS